MCFRYRCGLCCKTRETLFVSNVIANRFVELQRKKSKWFCTFFSFAFTERVSIANEVIKITTTNNLKDEFKLIAFENEKKNEFYGYTNV